tara:strand:+ start:313 stop:543 length:231 start_codon:yes stop_codon:yes gene_type:complete
MAEPLDLMNVIEVQEILKKCSPMQKICFEYIIKVANIRINHKGLDNDTPMPIENQIDPKLSDHESDDDYDLLEDSD